MQDALHFVEASIAPTRNGQGRQGPPSHGWSGELPDGVERQPRLLRLSLTWRVLGWWTVAYGLSSWWVEYLFSQFDPAGPIPFGLGLNRVVYAVVWSGAILVAIVATEALPITSRRQIGRVMAHVAVTLLVTVLWGVLSYYICLAVVPGWQPLGVAKMLSSTAKNVIFGYGLVVLLVHILLQVRLHRQREVAALREAGLAAQAHLQVLKMELQPHFLFNALHSISALMQSDVNAANDTLVRVSDMLRQAVDMSHVMEVPLREELATLQLFTQIEEVRFRDRLRLTWDIEPSTLEAAVPHMLLQPLVENAIKHGIEVHSGGGRIVITARRDKTPGGDWLCLSIWNEAPGQIAPGLRPGSGLGISNVRARLRQLYGERQSFVLDDTPKDGTLVTIRIPFGDVESRRAGTERLHGDSSQDLTSSHDDGAHKGS